MSLFKKTRIVYMGTPEFAVAPLQALVEKKYRVEGVVTVADKPAGRGLKLIESPVKQFAVANGIPVIAVNRIGFEPQNISEFEKCKKTKNPKENGIRFWGNSFVFGSQGEQIFRANDTDELAQVVTIDMQRCESVRQWWPFLRDRRIEAYGNLTKRFID